MRIARTIEEWMLEIRKQKELVIYGAGETGRHVCKFLQSRQIAVKAFTVTNQDKSWKVEGIPVYSLERILKGEQQVILVLAATSANQDSMEAELKKRRFSSYVKLSDAVLFEIIKENRRQQAKTTQMNKQKKACEKSIGYLTPGYLDTNYAEERLIIGKIRDACYIALPKETGEAIWAGDIHRIGWERYRQLVEACYCPKEYVPEVKLIHTFNMVCVTDRSWCASFETTMPRVWPETRDEKAYFLQLAECMKRPNCKALYAFCKNAYKIQKNHLMQYLPHKDVELLMAKTKVLHPPKKELITEEELVRKHEIQGIHFIFIGRAFFFKGGREIIQALSKFEDQYEFKLTLVSSLLYNDYFTKTPYEEMARWKKTIGEKRWIDYYDSLSNDKVLEKCREATIGLLPSAADTYGYAVLEMQAAGCPVITTNVRAFPEINHEECGWICELPVDASGCCAKEAKESWSEILTKELERCFQEIFEHPEQIKVKSRLALERIRTMHDPERYQQELMKNL